MLIHGRSIMGLSNIKKWNLSALDVEWPERGRYFAIEGDYFRTFNTFLRLQRTHFGGPRSGSLFSSWNQHSGFYHRRCPRPMLEIIGRLHKGNISGPVWWRFSKPAGSNWGCSDRFYNLRKRAARKYFYVIYLDSTTLMRILLACCAKEIVQGLCNDVFRNRRCRIRVQR